ncbi:piggyBac transposable element-derived protein 3-like [Schistocerca serialis cubense]|uniref:piggyBac transposable element-derived protein 3-like n=1 Tax=Schistocerca serialis cubense TaxID=2023355 RepID=UPI00214EB2DD|nr:piggyBac transposable element-derived protein 3-like [Schistocerca serialis cubense]
MIRFKGHNIMRQYVKNKPVKWGPEVGFGESVILQLTKSLSRLGCEIYKDSFFNSPALQYYLDLQSIRSCGTVRTNRKNIPKTFPPDKEMKRDDSYSLMKRRQSGSSEKIDVQCPLMIRKYNKWMGGVDLMDQKKVTYEIDRKAKIKYYLRIFFDLLDIGVNNARQRKLSTVVKTSRRLQTSCNPKSPDHRMIKSGVRKRCVHCASKCVENRTYNICDQCGVNLRFTSSRNCFAEFHIK